VEDYLKPVDGDVWIQAMRDESTDMPPFYPEWFGITIFMGLAKA